MDPVTEDVVPNGPIAEPDVPETVLLGPTAELVALVVG